MFSGYRTGREEHGPSVEMFRMLRDAGCDTTNEHDLQMGMISYSTALQVWKRRPTSKMANLSAERSHTGRNEPCSCGSGRKYKKCCLDKDRGFSADSYPLASLKFGPEILPRLWNERAVSEDCEILCEIMDRDPAFGKISFSRDKVASFMETVAKECPSFMDDDKEAFERTIDDLAIRYARESGEGDITKGMKDNIFAALTRAQSKDEMRALATGACMAVMGDALADPEANLLNVIFFRRALADAVRSAALIGKVADQLGGDAEELRRLMTTNDPSARENRILPKQSHRVGNRDLAGYLREEPRRIMEHNLFRRISRANAVCNTTGVVCSICFGQEQRKMFAGRFV